RFFDHVRYLDAFLDQIGITSAYIVAHDWGTALAFHLAARRPQFVRGLAFMEFIRPMSTWDDFYPGRFIAHRFRLASHAGQLGVSRTSCRSQESRRMCTRPSRKLTAHWRSPLTRNCSLPESPALWCRQPSPRAL